MEKLRCNTPFSQLMRWQSPARFGPMAERELPHNY
jgi:hypothetical protein